MGAFTAYSIPIQGLKIGVHHYKYSVNADFFRHFEGAPIQESELSFEVVLDKRPDMLLVDFNFAGYMVTECDRCTATIKLPLSDERTLIFKYGEAEGETEDEVVFIPRESSELNLAAYLYEFSVLSLPMTNTYDCQSEPEPPCNFEILARISTEEEAEQKNASVWDALKDLKTDDN